MGTSTCLVWLGQYGFVGDGIAIGYCSLFKFYLDGCQNSQRRVAISFVNLVVVRFVFSLAIFALEPNDAIFFTCLSNSDNHCGLGAYSTLAKGKSIIISWKMVKILKDLLHNCYYCDNICNNLMGICIYANLYRTCDTGSCKRMDL